MPSFQDSAFLVLLALLLFGPKGLAKLARELGKLMGEFRRASSEFRMQMEDEFRLSEQAEQKKKIEALEAAAPITPAFPAETIPEPEHPHAQHYDTHDATETEDATTTIVPHAARASEAAPLPIASSGGLDMMPPATGLPISRSASSPLGPIFDAIPQTPDPAEVTHNG